MPFHHRPFHRSRALRGLRCSMPLSMPLLLVSLMLALPAGAQIQLETPAMITGLTDPVAFVSAYDGSGRMFIVEQCVSGTTGRIKVWNGTSVLGTPFLDIPVQCGGERGLLGLAFHPDYETNGRFFVNYTDNATTGECESGDAGITRVVEFSNSDDPSDNVAGTSGTAIIEYCQWDSNHNAGQIVFGPDGYLYIPVGDGGGSRDNRENGENSATLLGSLLRIDVDGASPDYDIPASNPYPGNSRCAVNPEDEDTRTDPCPEMWAYGLRNPWRNSFDRLNGDLYLGDVGQGAWEEVSRLPWDPVGGEPLGGGDDDFGWDRCEGLHGHSDPGASPDLTDEDCDGDGTGSPPSGSAYKPPFVEYTSVGHCSVVGGYVYRGYESADLQGEYVFGDYCSGDIWTLPAQTADASVSWPDGSVPTPVMDVGFGLSSFGEGETGELYVVDIGGEIYRIIDPEAIFVHGFEMGLEAWSAVVP